MTKIRLAFCAIVALASLVAAAPASGAATIGSNLAGTANANTNCNIPCTTTNSALPLASQAPGGLVSPIDGIVTSWRVKSGSAGNPINLRVLRPGTGLISTGLATSAAGVTVSGIAGPFPTALPIKAGDGIGLNSPNAGLVLGPTVGATQFYWTPPLADGETRAAVAQSNIETFIQATVEPDVDCDLKGDETQDGILSDGPCKAPPKQTLFAKKKQKLKKATITATVDKASTVTVRAKVKGSKSSKVSTASLGANVATRIKLSFSRKAKRKIAAAIAARGPRRTTATVTATDTFGNVSTSTVSFKLTG